MAFDLLLKNGLVIDPLSQLQGQYDIGIHQGHIVSIHPPSVEKDGKEILDASGYVISPGLIDLHAHVFTDDTVLGIQADFVGVQQGVTTLVDAGSAGAATFPKFMQQVVKKNATQVLAWLNIAEDGLGAGLAELSDLTKIHTESVLASINEYPIIRGLKVRMSSSVLGANGLRPLEIGKELSKQAKIPLMVHVGNGPPDLGDILDILECGDVVTHAFHGKPGGIFRGDELLSQARNALQRGVLFDVGHGTSSFSVKTLQKAQRAGIKPDSISTDIYVANVQGPVYSLATTLSKFLALGFSLAEVIEAATIRPATILRMEHEIGSLQVGRRADLSIFKIEAGTFEFLDAEQQLFTGQQLLRPTFTIKAGKVLKCR